MAKNHKDAVKDTEAPVSDLAPGTSLTAPVQSGAPALREEAPSINAMATRDVAPEETGFEDFTGADLSVAWLNLLQKGSPQVDPDQKDKNIAGARSGFGFNSITEQLYDLRDGHLLIVPVHRTHSFVEWKPRKQGGGFIASHAVDSAVVKAGQEAAKKLPKDDDKLKSGKIPGPDGNELQETFHVFVIAVTPDGTVERFVMAFASTNIKNYKKWMTVSSSIMDVKEGRGKVQAAMWSRRYKLTSEFNEDNGQTWFTWKIKLDAPAESKNPAADAKLDEGDELTIIAKAFRALVTSGQAKVQMDAQRGAEGSASGHQVDQGTGAF